MTKSLLVLLTIALVAATIVSHSRALAATTADDSDDPAERQELLRVFSNPASVVATDSETIHRLARLLKREIGPLGTVFKAIRTVPENSAANVRAKEEASDAAMGLLFRHFRQILSHGSGMTNDEL